MDDPSTYEPTIEESVFITGSRRYGRQTDVLRVVELAMKGIIRDTSLKCVYLGGAIGIDTLALKVLRMYRGSLKNSFPFLIVVCPNTVDDLPEEARSVADKCADRYVELGNRITADDRYESFHIRNRYMVDRSREGRAFWNQESLNCGTISAVNYATKLGKPTTLATIPKPPARSHRR